MRIPLLRKCLQVAFILVISGQNASVQAQDRRTPASCPMTDFDFTSSGGGRHRLLTRPEDPASDRSLSSIFVIAPHLAVDADGSPRAYHPRDARGKKYAIDTMCSASTKVTIDGKPISCFRKDGESEAVYKRRLATYYEGFEAFASDNDFWRAPDEGFDPANDPTYDPNEATPVTGFATIFMAQETLAAAFKRDIQVSFHKYVIKSWEGKPCVRKKGTYKGYFVNFTAMDSLARNSPDQDDGTSTDAGCRHPIKVDAERLPGFVLPVGKLQPDEGGLPPVQGDIVIGYRPKTNQFVYGVVYDAAGRDGFAEASLAFNRILKKGYGSTWRPRSVAELNALSIEEPVGILILRGTHDRFERNFAPKRVAREAVKAFQEWADATTRAEAERRLKSCFATLRANANRR